MKMEVKEMEEHGFILIAKDDEPTKHHSHGASLRYMSEIDEHIDTLQDALWPLNKFIHRNPELAFKEYKAHDALTEFMSSQDGWEVTPSAYGIQTAWTAVYDTGKKGPVVSFNAEMGTQDTTLTHHPPQITSR